jgi:hypothetical protein
VLCTLLVLAVTAQASLSYSRVHLVHHNPDTNNFYFRGNMPVNDTSKTFQYDLLQQYFSQRAEAAGLVFPEENYLVDIIFNNPIDSKKAEKEFWKNNPDKGKAVNWVLFGNIIPPSTVPEDQLENWCINDNTTVWAIDQIPTRIETLHKWMADNSTGVPQVFYTHCSAGCDRTGEFVGSYRTRFMLDSVPFQNITGVYALDVSECGRPPNFYSTTALEWYCYTYQFQFNKDIGACTEFATCKPFGDCEPTINVTTALTSLQDNKYASFRL